MIDLNQAPLTTTYRGRELRLDGGWIVSVPEIRVVESDEMFHGLVKYRMQDGLDGDEAEQDVKERIRHQHRQAWQRGARYSIRRWMKVYAKKFPRLVTEGGELRGFDPQPLADRWFPGENKGRAGKEDCRVLLVEMGKEAKRSR